MRHVLIKICVVVLLLCLCIGCSTISSTFLRYEEEKGANIEIVIQATEKMLDNWGFRSGFRKQILAGLEMQLPGVVNQAMDDLDELYLKYKSNGKLTDFELGTALACITIIRSKIAQVAIEKFAPALIQYLPMGL